MRPKAIPQGSDVKNDHKRVVVGFVPTQPSRHELSTNALTTYTADRFLHLSQGWYEQWSPSFD